MQCVYHWPTYDRHNQIGRTSFYLYERLHDLRSKRWNYENEIYSPIKSAIRRSHFSLTEVQQCKFPSPIEWYYFLFRRWQSGQMCGFRFPLVPAMTKLQRLQILRSPVLRYSDERVNSILRFIGCYGNPCIGG